MLVLLEDSIKTILPSIAVITASSPSGGNPNYWCICTCSVTGCNELCFGNGGHNGICKCIKH